MVADEENRSEDMHVDFLQPYFRERCGDLALEITAIEKFPRGVSRETWFIACRTGIGGSDEEHFVLRRDLRAGSICLGDLRSEYEVYRRLNGSGIPVAETLWFEDDDTVLRGRRPFFVRRHVDGSWSVTDYGDPAPQFNALRLEIGREHVRKLGMVHTCDWKSLGFDRVLAVPPSAEESAAFRINELLSEINRIKTQPLPLVTYAANWLLANLPKDSGVVCLVKGTNGLGEEIFQGNTIVAMSDWELACLGDPAMDFALAQTFLDDVYDGDEQIWGMRQALNYYHSLTGIRIELNTVNFYKELYGLYRVQYSQAAASQMKSDKLCRLPWLAIEVLHLGNKALAHTIGCTELSVPEMGQKG